MVQLADTKHHKIFPVAQRGSCLVVTPRGDAAGFGHAELKVERDHVVQLIQSGPCPNLVLDMQDANYFGSEMIGIISRMISATQDRGGRHAVVNVSPDMREGIAIMKLDDVWNISEERAALRELGRESVFGPVGRSIKPILLTCAAIALLAVAYVVISRIPRTRAINDYNALQSIWIEYHETVDRALTDEEMAVWKRNQRLEVEAIVARLEPRATADQRDLQSLVWAGRDNLAKMLDPGIRRVDGRFAEEFLRNMQDARMSIWSKYHVEVPKVVRPTSMGPEPKPSDTPVPGTLGDAEPNPDGESGHDADPVPKTEPAPSDVPPSATPDGTVPVPDPTANDAD